MSHRDPSRDPIDQSWIKNYAAELIRVAERAPPGVARDRAILQINAVLIMVKTWRER